MDLQRIVADLKAEREWLTRTIVLLERTGAGSSVSPRAPRTAKRATKAPPRAMGTTLERAHQRFEGWRKARRPASRIPEALWALAVEAARAEGVNKTVTSLQLNYNVLKKRVNAAHKPTGVFTGSVGRKRRR